MRKAVELEPLEVNQRMIFGRMSTMRGRPVEGLREIERAIQLEPSNRRGWQYKAITVQLVGDLASSIEAGRMAIELDPEWSLGVSQIAKRYLYLGDLEAYRTWMDEAMRRGVPQDIAFEARYLLLSGRGGAALELALREFDTQGAPYTNAALMRIVVADMITRRVGGGRAILAPL